MKPLTHRIPDLRTDSTRRTPMRTTRSRRPVRRHRFTPGLSHDGYLPRISYVRAFALLAIIAVLVALAVLS